MKSNAILALVIALLAGCASTPASKSFEVSATELGIAYYYPRARLQVVQQSTNRYTFTLIPGPFARLGAIQDASLVTGFYAVGFFCPAWRLAKKTGASAAILSFPDPSNTEAGIAEVTLAEQAVRAPEAKGKERIEAVNFSDESWQATQRTWCDHPEKLNRAWNQ